MKPHSQQNTTFFFLLPLRLEICDGRQQQQSVINIFLSISLWFNALNIEIEEEKKVFMKMVSITIQQQQHKKEKKP
jgi:hypothetical protein